MGQFYSGDLGQFTTGGDTLRAGIEYGRRFLDPKCGCALEDVKQRLRAKGVNLSAR